MTVHRTEEANSLKKRTIRLDEKSTDLWFEDRKMLKKKDKDSFRSYGETTNLGIDDENTLERKEKRQLDWENIELRFDVENILK